MKAIDLYQLAEQHIERRNYALAKLLYLAGDELTTIEAYDRDLEAEHVRPSQGESTEIAP